MVKLAVGSSEHYSQTSIYVEGMSMSSDLWVG